MKRELFALLLLSFECLVTVNVLWLFLMVPWVGLQFVIVVFPVHSHLHFAFCFTCVNVYIPSVAEDDLLSMPVVF